MAKPEKSKGKGGRPRKSAAKPDPFRPVRPGRPDALVPDERTLKQMEAFGRRMSTYVEAASLMGVSLTALNNFREKWPEAQEAWDRGRANSCVSVREAQLKSALAGHFPAQRWFGINYLGQTDKVEQTSRGEIAIHIDADDAEL